MISLILLLVWVILIYFQLGPWDMPPRHWWGGPVGVIAFLITMFSFAGSFFKRGEVVMDFIIRAARAYGRWL